jgi:Arylmalonate decarboxylase
MAELTPPGVSLHFTRMSAEGPAGTHAGQEERNRSQVESIPACVRLLSMVAPGVIVLAHTATSYTLGEAREAALVAEMEALGNARFITAFGSVLAAFEALGVRRIAYATPYSADMTAQGKAHLETCGVNVVKAGHLDNVRNIYQETSERAYAIARQGRPFRRGGDIPQRRGHADARCVAGAGRRYRQAGDFGGVRHDVACAANRRCPPSILRLRAIAARRFLTDPPQARHKSQLSSVLEIVPRRNGKIWHPRF